MSTTSSPFVWLRNSLSRSPCNNTLWRLPSQALPQEGPSRTSRILSKKRLVSDVDSEHSQDTPPSFSTAEVPPAPWEQQVSQVQVPNTPHYCVRFVFNEERESLCERETVRREQVDLCLIVLCWTMSMDHGGATHCGRQLATAAEGPSLWKPSREVVLTPP